MSHPAVSSLAAFRKAHHPAVNARATSGALAVIEMLTSSRS
jgi:hypothetical protein